MRLKMALIWHNFLSSFLISFLNNYAMRCINWTFYVFRFSSFCVLFVSLNMFLVVHSKHFILEIMLSAWRHVTGQIHYINYEYSNVGFRARFTRLFFVFWHTHEEITLDTIPFYLLKYTPIFSNWYNFKKRPYPLIL